VAGGAAALDGGGVQPVDVELVPELEQELQLRLEGMPVGGGHGAFVEAPDAIRPALERAMQAVREGTPALVNVVTDWRARASTAAFTRYVT
jgi:hypothetical protein